MLAAVVATMLAAGTVDLTLRQAVAQTQPMSCTTGPVPRTIGGSDWLVFSCDDKASLLFTAAPGSSAYPFYFTIRTVGGSARLSGEGTGSRAATDATARALRAMTASDIAGLIAATEAGAPR